MQGFRPSRRSPFPLPFLPGERREAMEGLARKRTRARLAVALVAIAGATAGCASPPGPPRTRRAPWSDPRPSGAHRSGSPHPATCGDFPLRLQRSGARLRAPGSRGGRDLGVPAGGGGDPRPLARRSGPDPGFGGRDVPPGRGRARWRPLVRAASAPFGARGRGCCTPTGGAQVRRGRKTPAGGGRSGHSNGSRELVWGRGRGTGPSGRSGRAWPRWPRRWLEPFSPSDERRHPSAGRNRQRRGP